MASKLFDKGPKATTNELRKDQKVDQEPQSTLMDIAANAVEDSEGFKEAPIEEEASKEIDLSDLNESTLLKYPIVAKSLSDLPMAVIKPKDPSIVFHWCFYDRAATGSTARVVAANIQRYKFWGFTFATIEDVEGGEEALGDGMIDDGGMITNYDTVLMKVDKVRLMSHYKANLLKSLEMTDSDMARVIRDAELSIRQDGTYQKAKSKHPKAKIEFYSPGA